MCKSISSAHSDDCMLTSESLELRIKCAHVKHLLMSKHNKDLQRQLAKKMAAESILIDDNTHESLMQVLNINTIENEFVKLFWGEQQKTFTLNLHGMRWQENQKFSVI